MTFDNIPKVLERMEQRKKVHESCAQIVLDVARLENQQKLILERIAENSELLKEVKEGMEENTKICAKNMQDIK